MRIFIERTIIGLVLLIGFLSILLVAAYFGR